MMGATVRWEERSGREEMNAKSGGLNGRIMVCEAI